LKLHWHMRSYWAALQLSSPCGDTIQQHKHSQAAVFRTLALDYFGALGLCFRPACNVRQVCARWTTPGAIADWATETSGALCEDCGD